MNILYGDSVNTLKFEFNFLRSKTALEKASNYRIVSCKGKFFIEERRRFLGISGWEMMGRDVEYALEREYKLYEFDTEEECEKFIEELKEAKRLEKERLESLKMKVVKYL